MPLLLRPMSENDLPQVENLEKECFSDPWSYGILSDLLKSEWDESWVLLGEDGALYGYINYRFLAGEGELMRIAVREEVRGLGYSRKLMEQMVRSAAENQILDLTLEVRAGNVPAIGLYKTYGFRKEAVRKNYYHDPEEDAFIMWRRHA